MKKLKIIVLLPLLLLVTGCISYSLEIDIKNDDSGKFVLSMGYDEKLLEEYEEEDLFEGIAEGFEDKVVIISDYIKEKNGNKYIGKKIQTDFASLDELNELITSTDDGESGIEFIRDGDKVTIKMDGDPDSYEDITEYYDGEIDYNITIKIEGKIINHNATEFDKGKNTLTWDLENLTNDGIEVTYDTSKKAINNIMTIVYVVAGILFLSLVLFFVNTIRKKKI